MYNAFPTYIQDLDFQILLELDDKSLNDLCSINNRYIRTLCNNDRLFEQKLDKSFTDLKKFKPDNVSMKQFYLSLPDYFKENYNNLNLSDLVDQIIINDDGSLLVYLMYQGYKLSGHNVNLASEYGSVDILNAIYNIEPNLINHSVIYYACLYGHLNILEWASDLTDPTFENLPNQHDINTAASRGHVDILDWAINKFDIYPEDYAINIASRKGFTNVAKWMDDILYKT